MESAMAQVHEFKLHNTNLIRTKRPYYLAKDQWTANSPNLNSSLYTMADGNAGSYHNLHPKPKTIVELQETLQMIWDSLPQRSINKAVKKFPK